MIKNIIMTKYNPIGKIKGTLNLNRSMYFTYPIMGIPSKSNNISDTPSVKVY